MKYYSLKKILSKNATYNVIFGERSNGKTYAALKLAVETWVKNKTEFAYVRRWKEDLTGKRAAQIFAALNNDGFVKTITGGEFDKIHYWAGKFYFASLDENGKVIYNDNNCLGHCFAISDVEHNKSISYPKVELIIFDEFLTNKIYLPDEFINFMNVVSTIVRQRETVKILMLGNTVNKFCPYFKEMGLTNIESMKQGSIDIYRYGDSKLTVAVEYCASTNKTDKKSNLYFAFDNPKLSMITGGAWELDLYPHLPIKYKPKDVLLRYFIIFSGKIYDCNIISTGDFYFTYIHEKTTDIKNPDKYIVYSLEQSAKPNYNTRITKPQNRVQQKILWFFEHNRVFFQNNDVGNAIHNYIKVSK